MSFSCYVLYVFQFCISPLSSFILFPYVSPPLLFLLSSYPYSLLPFPSPTCHAFHCPPVGYLISPCLPSSLLCYLLSSHPLSSSLFSLFSLFSPCLSSPLLTFPLLSLRLPLLFYHIAYFVFFPLLLHSFTKFRQFHFRFFVFVFEEEREIIFISNLTYIFIVYHIFGFCSRLVLIRAGKHTLHNRTCL